MKSDFIMALTQLAAERNLPREIVLSAIEAALISAYRRDGVAAGQDISVKLDPATGDVSVHVVKTAVEEVTDPQQEVSLAEAREIRADAEIGQVIATETLPHSAGRIAAQTAKQVVMQRLRDAERELVYQEFADKEGDVFTVTIQRMEPKQIIVELGRAEAILPPSEQSPYDRYRVGQRMKVLLQSIRQSNKGPEIIVSRSDKVLLKRLFEMEVPEVYSGAVEILGIAREAGSRSKVAVWAKQDGVDAVGSCVGLRGIRIQNIVNELHGEKIDVVEWNKDPVKFIASALSPATVMRVDVDLESASAEAIVPERQLSLAIGKEGQNARLAARLTGLKVDIKSDVAVAPPKEAKAVTSVAEKVAARGAQAPGIARTLSPEQYAIPLERLELSSRVVNALKQAGVDRIGQILEMKESALQQIKNFGEKSLAQVYDRLGGLDQLLREVEVGARREAEVDEKAAGEILEADGETTQPLGVSAEEQPAAEPVAEAAVAEGEQALAQEPAPEPSAAEVGTEEAAAPPAAEPPVVPELPPELILPGEEPEPVAEPVGVVEPSTSIQDLPEGIWALSSAGVVEPGAIRFAEDIQELKRGPGAKGGRRRSGPRRGGAPAFRGRKAKAGRKR